MAFTVRCPHCGNRGRYTTAGPYVCDQCSSEFTGSSKSSAEPAFKKGFCYGRDGDYRVAWAPIPQRLNDSIDEA